MTEIDTSPAAIEAIIARGLECDCDAPDDCGDENCALARKTCDMLRALSVRLKQAKRERDEARFSLEIWQAIFLETRESNERLIRDLGEARARLADVVDKSVSVVEKSLFSAQSPLQAWQECHDGIRALIPLEDAYALDRIRAEERKRCAKVADKMAELAPDENDYEVCKAVAVAIREDKT